MEDRRYSKNTCLGHKLHIQIHNHRKFFSMFFSGRPSLQNTPLLVLINVYVYVQQLF